MKGCVRGLEPQLLHDHAAAITREYLDSRAKNPGYTFQWPKRDGLSVYEVVRAALAVMTDGRCAYCDGHPTVTGTEEVDHFRPKTRSEFYDLVCAWDNLFLVCTGCNRAKRNHWDEALLRPDADDFDFSRYFSYRTDTGNLEPNPTAQPEDRLRAQRTIDLLDLNRSGACIGRRHSVKIILSSPPEVLDDVSYRYLIPLCKAA